MLDEVVGHRLVDVRDAGDVDDDDLRAVRADAVEQLLGELAGALAVQDADDRQDQQPLADGQDRRRQLADRVLLLPDDPLALVDEADGDGVGDPVGRRLVGVEHAVQQPEVALVLLEQGPGQDVAQQQHDADDLVRLHAARDDPLGQVARVALQGLDAARLEHLDVVVVDRRGLGGHLLGRHGMEQARPLDPAGPVVPQPSSGARAGGRRAGGAAGPRRAWSIAGKSAETSSVTFGVVGPSSSLTTPFRHRHRRAAADLRHDRELVHQPSSAGKSQPEPVVGAVAVLQGLFDVGDARSGVPGDDPHARGEAGRAARSTTSPEPAKRTMLRATSETAVAMRVRSVRREPEAGGQLSRGLSRRDDVAVGRGWGCAPRRRAAARAP